MDEMTLLRRMRAEVPLLEPEELAVTIEGLWEKATPDGGFGPRARRSRRTSGPTRWRARTAVALGLVAAAIAAAVILPQVRHQPHPRPPGGAMARPRAGSSPSRGAPGKAQPSQ